MGVFDKKKKCAVCGKELLEEGTNPTFGMMAHGMNLDFSEIANRVLLSMQMPAMVCEKCGATVCRGCQPLHDSPSNWQNWPNCPKCSSNMKSAQR